MRVDHRKLERLVGPGSVPKGEEHVLAKANDAVVREIRALHAQGYGYLVISRATGLSKSQVRKIVKRLAWAHID